MRLTMQLGPRSYDIVLKRGSLLNAGKLCNLRRKILLVSDEGVPASYVKTLAAQCEESHILVLPQGEKTKSVHAWQTVLGRMIELGFGRQDAVAAVGGGVIGDLAGFAAASYMRGVDYLGFPTTTLSQIDSSIGGKVAINLPAAKNVVGAFHQPHIVIADPDTLATLPPRHFANGVAEALKAALLGDADLFELLEKGEFENNIERIVGHSLLYKKSVVEEDETEQGVRRLLNLGHTIGHGIEAACGFGQGEKGLLHGECVGIGMLPMISNKTLRRRTVAVLKKLCLPTRSPVSASEIVPFITRDKKRTGDEYYVIKVKKLAQPEVEKMSMEEICLLMEEIL